MMMSGVFDKVVSPLRDSVGKEALRASYQDLTFNKWGEVEPYGWKIGIKGESQLLRKAVQKRKERRQINQLKWQKKIQSKLSIGID